MKAHILKYTSCVALILLAGGLGYFLGFKRAGTETARISDAGALMFFTGIHRLIEQGECDEARRIAGAAASCQIMAIDNIDRYPLQLHFWSMFPYKGMPDMRAWTTKQLTDAYEHFSKHPGGLQPEAIKYLESINQKK